MSPLRPVVERFKDKRIVVLGDLVADVFVYGEISRISREAPVLILNHRETQVVPGGGANAIHNLSALGAKPIPVGIRWAFPAERLHRSLRATISSHVPPHLRWSPQRSASPSSCP